MRRPGSAACAGLSMLVWVAGVVPCRARENAVSDAGADIPQAVPSPSPTPAPPLIPGPGAHPRPDDKRRTLRSYGHNLVYDFVAVLQRDNHKPLLITAALTAPSFALDDAWQDYFHDHPHENFGKIGANLGGGFAVAGLSIGLFSAGRISRGDTFRAASYDLSQAILINQVYVGALKLIVQRERPDGSDNLSFPSGHASNAFAMASVIARHYKKLAIPAYAFGTYVALSRMAAGKHFFSDIVAGSGLGVSIGRVVVRRNGRPPDPKPETGEPPPEKATWNIAPYAGPSGDGRGFALILRF